MSLISPNWVDDSDNDTHLLNPNTASENLFDEDDNLILHNDYSINRDNDFTQSIENLPSPILKTFKRRWYILAVYSSLAFMQGALGNVWAVIAPSTEAVYGWSDSQISLMQAWLYITYLVALIPFAFLIDRVGIRTPMVISSILVVFGTAARCITTIPPYSTFLAHFAHMLLGLAGPVVFSGGPTISALWFPTNQRTTATAIATIAGYAGGAGTFLFGPMIVEAPFLPLIPDQKSSSNITNIEEMRKEILLCRYIECSICVLITIFVCAYFPSQPKISPSFTAAIKKLSILTGFQQLAKKENRNFWLICFPYCIAVSIYGVWAGLMGVNLKGILSEIEIGWLGFSAVTAGCITAILLGRLSDIFAGKMKIFLLVLNVAFIIVTFWFILISHNYITFSKTQLFAAGILQGLFNNGAIPLYYELAIESSYPIPEVCCSAMLTCVYNIIPLLFLCIFLIPNVGTFWMDWTLYGAGLISFPLLLLMKESYKRFMIDNRATNTLGHQVIIASQQD